MAHRHKSANFSNTTILTWLQDQPGAQAAGAISRALGVRRHERRDFFSLLAEMTERGELERLKGDRYRLAPRKQLEGTVSLHRDGYGFLAVDAASQPDVFLPARELHEVMNGDRLKVSVVTDSRGRHEGRLEGILHRAHTEVLGVIQRGSRENLVTPFGPDSGRVIVVPRGQAMQATPGQVVVVQIKVYPQSGRPAQGSVSRILGDREDPEVEVLVAAHRFGLPDEFSLAALQEAADISQDISATELAGRKDLRELPFVTIDGETAKDFDDAVALAETAEGYRLWVAIADVGHYVRPGSALDREARERGTSVYFPGQCLPMLPEPLSNGICSLMPGVNRLVMVAELHFNRMGERTRSEFFPAVLRSRGRLTYTAVQGFFDRNEQWPTDCPEIFPQLLSMQQLAANLIQRRHQRGGLDFELPEAEILLDDKGKTIGVRKTERLFAHRLIEEFMLAANEAVATELEQRDCELLFRVHEPPSREKLENFQQFVAHFNYGLRLDAEVLQPRVLQELLAEVAGKPEAKAINQLLLRSMKQACYAADNLGHFGLAIEHYCHFTSPIRRYPDLVVHRALGSALLGRANYSHEELTVLGEELSRKERRAMDAERDVVSLKKCQYMAGHLGEDYSGVVCGVQPYGLFVELSETFVEGLVHISSLTDDYYHFDEELQRLIGYNRRRIFQVGETVEVRLARVDLESREIDFVLRDLDNIPHKQAAKARR